MRKPTIWVPTRSDTNRAVQSQIMVRGWTFWKVEKLYYPCSVNKGADQLRKYFCAFVFAFADCCFSHAAAHIWLTSVFFFFFFFFSFSITTRIELTRFDIIDTACQNTTTKHCKPASRT